MLNFNSIQWCNFLSTGNVPTKIDLNNSSTTLIIGKNGNGKSTLLDALCFALYGKPFRNITKGQLVNSVNGKACKVEIELESDGKKYKVIRGIKPNIFEIFIDGQLVSQDAALKDYQKTLEKQILKMNYKTFTQVVILGASSFTPFMKLSAGHRREVIEDILDIKIFSTMSSVLKEKITETKDELNSINQKITVAKGQAVSQKNLIDMMKSSREDNRALYETKIDTNSRRIEALEKDVSIISDDVKAKWSLITNDTVLQASFDSYKSKFTESTIKINRIQSDIDFFDEHNDCPSCKQYIGIDHKHDMLESFETAKDVLNSDRSHAKTEMLKAQSMLQAILLIKDEIRQLEIDKAGIESEIRSLRKQSADYQATINSESANTGDIDQEKTKLKNMAASITTMLERKIALTETRNLQDVSIALLKDTGFKANIIREYLPLMNKLINKYLQIQDLYVQFEIDEQFNEVIKSRHRDEFTYESFSEGERQRIDLSILFTWRQIAKLKNSANTNLLILDEILDGSLDDEGTESAQKLIDSLTEDGTNVFVVSHSVDQHIEKFERVLKFQKKNNFSLMGEVK